jgi:hypothetical protein
VTHSLAFDDLNRVLDGLQMGYDERH